MMTNVDALIEYLGEEILEQAPREDLTPPQERQMLLGLRTRINERLEELGNG